MAVFWADDSDRASTFQGPVGTAAASAPAPSGRRPLLADLACLAGIAAALALVVLLALLTT